MSDADLLARCRVLGEELAESNGIMLASVVGQIVIGLVDRLAHDDQVMARQNEILAVLMLENRDMRARLIELDPDFDGWQDKGDAANSAAPGDLDRPEDLLHPEATP